MPFNSRKPSSRKKLRPHCVKEYKAKEDRVECVCGFMGTVDEFDNHFLLLKIRRKGGDLSFLSEIRWNRMDYYNQSCGSPYRINDEEFL